jgi:hypothetical protein
MSISNGNEVSTEHKSEDLMVDAISNRVTNQFLSSPAFKHLKSALFAIVAITITFGVGGSIYTVYKVMSIHDRAAKAEKDIALAEEKVSSHSKEVVKASNDFRSVIEMRIGALSQDAELRMDKAAKNVEILVEPTKRHLEAAETAASNKIKGAVAEIEKERDIALIKLKVKSIDELDGVRRMINALSEESGRLNLTSIRAFVDVEMGAILVFSVLAFLISIVTLIRSWKKR